MQKITNIFNQSGLIEKDIAFIERNALDRGSKGQKFEPFCRDGINIFIALQKQIMIIITSMPDVKDLAVGTVREDFEDLIQPILGAE